MISSLPPGFIMVLGALLVPFLPHIIRQVYMMILILISSYSLTLGFGIHSIIDVMDYEFILFQSDALTLPFAIIFHIPIASKSTTHIWHNLSNATYLHPEVDYDYNF